VLAYDGTDYAGWQVQPATPTVQGVLADTLRRLFDPGARVVGASRTDAGVHALGQVASVALRTGVAAGAVMRALNATLPRDIRVLEAADAPPGFDARRAATGKRYAYLLDTAPVASPLLRRVAWHVPQALDLGAVRRGLGLLRGRHDFTAFCAAPGRAADPACRVRALHVVRRGDRAALFISADRFLHHMVRNIVGCAVAIGRGLREPGWMGDVLASRDRSRAAATAPAHGLTLVRVLYSP
jgi:tRNA pseudouridine38-40 synthase